MGYSWSIPVDMTLTEVDYGLLRFIVRVDTGPFGGKVEGVREFKLRR
jgi:hypothetical protein